jgi:hypothetical protein
MQIDGIKLTPAEQSAIVQLGAERTLPTMGNMKNRTKLFKKLVALGCIDDSGKWTSTVDTLAGFIHSQSILAAK